MSEMVVQIHPVVSRLCAPIEGTDAAHIADCLGLDASSVLTSPSPISCNNLWWITTSDWQVYVHLLGCAIQTVISVPWRICHVQLSCLSCSWGVLFACMCQFHQRQGTTNTSERDEALLSSAAILDDDDQYALPLLYLACCSCWTIITGQAVGVILMETIWVVLKAHKFMVGQVSALWTLGASVLRLLQEVCLWRC